MLSNTLWSSYLTQPCTHESIKPAHIKHTICGKCCGKLLDSLLGTVSHTANRRVTTLTPLDHMSWYSSTDFKMPRGHLRSIGATSHCPSSASALSSTEVAIYFVCKTPMCTCSFARNCYGVQLTDRWPRDSKDA